MRSAVRYVVLAWQGTRLTAHYSSPSRRGKGPGHSSPCLPSPLPILTSSQGASSSVINVLLHLSLSSLSQARLYSDFTAFLQTQFSNYGSVLTVNILSSALENSSRTIFASSLWRESRGRIPSQRVQKSSSSKFSTLYTAQAILSSPPWTMVVSRMTVSSWRFPGHHHRRPHISPVRSLPLPSKV